MKICYIFGAGNCEGAYISGRSFIVIAADGGYSYLKSMNINPDLVVGDFDSLGYVPNNVDVILHPTEKNDTDTMLAVKKGIDMGCDTFIIYGGLGGRLDHTISNIQTLAYICKNGYRGFLCGEGSVLTVTDSDIIFSPNLSGYISVFGITEMPHVTLKGLKYLIDDYILCPTDPIGVSNEFCGIISEIKVSAGRVLIIWNQSAKNFAENLLDE